jgi:hypothetical protein
MFQKIHNDILLSEAFWYSKKLAKLEIYWSHQRLVHTLLTILARGLLGIRCI